MQSKGLTPVPKGSDINSAQFQMWFNQLMNAVPFTQTFSLALSPAPVANGGTEQTFGVPGLQATDIVSVNKPSYQAGLGIVNARVSAAGTLAIQFSNNTGSPITPRSETYLIKSTRL